MCENAQNFWNRLLLKPDTGKIIVYKNHFKTIFVTNNVFVEKAL